MDSIGLLYFAKGDTFVNEATISARQSKVVMPETPITLVCDRPVDEECFDTVVLDETPFEKRDKPTAMCRTPYDRTIYLDTDTWLSEPLDSVFSVLDEFDIGVVPNRKKAHVPRDLPWTSDPNDSVPDSFSEYNTGVVAYRDSEAVAELFDEWRRMCKPDHSYDQRSFRPALYRSDCRIASLPNRYNCQYNFDNDIEGPVVVFHGPLIDRERQLLDPAIARSVLSQSTERRRHYRYRDRLFIDKRPSVRERLSITARCVSAVRSEHGWRGVQRWLCDEIEDGVRGRVVAPTVDAVLG